MKQRIAVLALGFTCAISAYAACDPMTGQSNGLKCTLGELSSACDTIKYDSSVCQAACRAGEIGQQSSACQQIRAQDAGQ